jgi:hypothetical protein
MSGDHAKREIMTGEKAASWRRTLSKESGNKYKEESSSSIKLHRRGDKKKKMKKVVYYETDSSSPSTSSSESSTTSKRHERKKYSKCNALNLGVEFFLLFSHQIRALLSFLFLFRSFFLISNQYIDRCLCHV